MKVLIAFCVCGLSFASGQTDFRTFISPDGVFQFNYSRVLVRCTLEVGGEEGYPGSWVPSEDCNSQAGLCDDVASAANTIICLAYPKDTFKEKPKFSGAALFLAEIGAASTSQACLEGSKNWLIEGTKSVRVGSVKAKHFRTSDAWTSGGQTGDIYRVFHGKKCYELGIQQAGTSAGAYNPGTIKEFTKQDQDMVYTCLKKAVDSFRFLK
jgi:hypothetical protein